MPDPDHDAESEPVTDPRFDNWPVRRYDADDDLTVERETPGDAENERLEDVEWVGVGGPGVGGNPYLYAPQEETVHRGRYDAVADRIVVDEDERAVDEEESLGDHLVDIGEDHDWHWLSSFAREHLDTPEHDADRPTSGHLLPPGFDHEFTEFQRRNVAESSDVDAAFWGSHTFADETDRVHVLEREFGVRADDAADRVDVHVEERYLVAEEPREESRAGDADLVDEREYDLALDVEPGETAWVADTEDLLTRWHRRHLAPPERDEHRQVNREAYGPDDGRETDGTHSEY
ncbi:hypothetical protein [Halosimplex amylolyticum]|uniref:hypothetical protein n=1 Tax=Halosimplex amylolyticum TaxID=3396616 RepID=UPI003F54EFBE